MTCSPCKWQDKRWTLRTHTSSLNLKHKLVPFKRQENHRFRIIPTVRKDRQRNNFRKVSVKEGTSPPNPILDSGRTTRPVNQRFGKTSGTVRTESNRAKRGQRRIDPATRRLQTAPPPKTSPREWKPKSVRMSR